MLPIRDQRTDKTEVRGGPIGKIIQNKIWMNSPEIGIDRKIEILKKKK